MKHWRVGLLGIVVSVLAIYFILTQINRELFSEAWASARYGYVVPCVAFLLAGLVTRAIRWRVLLNDGLPLRRAFSMMNVAYLVNNVLPLRIGEVARMFLATRATPPVPVLKSASTIVVERLLDMLAVVMMLALALTVGPLPEQLQTTGALGGVAAVGGFLFLVFLASHRQLAHAILAWLLARLPLLARLHLDKRLSEVLDGLEPLTRLPTLLAAFGWTALSWGLSAAAGYVLMLAFFEQANWAATCLYIAAAAFAIAVPAVPGNVGPYEVAIIWALGAVGYHESGAATAFAVLVHAVNVLVHTLTGAVGLLQEGISLGQLSQGVREMQKRTSG